jgi:hypothetical protein
MFETFCQYLFLLFDLNSSVSVVYLLCVCLKQQSGFTPLASESDYPDSLRALPLMTLAMLKHTVFRDGTDTRTGMCIYLSTYML